MTDRQNFDLAAALEDAEDRFRAANPGGVETSGRSGEPRRSALEVALERSPS